VVLDARRGEIYGAVYDAAGRLVVPESVGNAAEWLATLPGGEMEFISPDFSAFSDALPAAPRVTAPRALAGAVAAIAAERLARGTGCDPAALDANYVRRADAELFWRE
jgi:tRNA threonylcarbamoyladenosine biosynthesis protein TsaB